MEQIYTQLQALTSKAIALKSVEYHMLKQGIELEKSVKEKKAEGVAYLVQNAIDYYDSAATKNLTQQYEFDLYFLSL